MYPFLQLILVVLASIFFTANVAGFPGMKRAEKPVFGTEKIVAPLADPSTGILAIPPQAKVHGLRRRSVEYRRP
jgi:hypothetical protein